MASKQPAIHEDEEKKGHTAVADPPHVKPTPLPEGHAQHPEGIGASTIRAGEPSPTAKNAETQAVTPMAFPVFGSVPTNTNQILASFGAKGTHFTGPLLTGGPPGRAISGSALSTVFLRVDYSMGNFSLPIQFPTDALLLWMVTFVYTAFAGGAGDTTVALGTAASGTQILAAKNMGALRATTISPVTGMLPYSTDTNLFQAFITVTNGTNTSGSGVVALVYANAFRKWD